MKVINRVYYGVFVLIFTCQLIFAQKASVQFNGSYECSTVFNSVRLFNNRPSLEDHNFSWGMNNFANLRFKSNISKYLEFQFAVNINMLSGSMTDFYRLYYLADASSIFGRLSNPASLTDIDSVKSGFLSIPFFYRSTYIGGFELERMFFKVKFDYATITTGLIRYARGFGYAFSPNDFFNPRNAVNLDARPSGQLTFLTTLFPGDFWVIDIFAIAPSDPLESRGWGFKFGISTDILNLQPKNSNVNFNLQFIYTLVMPETDYTDDKDKLKIPANYSGNFTHIAGFSMHADVEVKLTVDMIYRFEHRNFITGEFYGNKFYGYEGLEFAFGLDYTTAKGHLYFMIEYLFYGGGMLGFGEEKLDRLYADNISGVPVSHWTKNKPISRFPNQELKSQFYSRHNYLYTMIRAKINDLIFVGNSFLFGIEDISGIITTFINIEPVQNLSISITAMVPIDRNLFNSSYQPGEFGPVNLGFNHGYKLTVKFKF